MGRPSLVARLRSEVSGSRALDADGDLVAWIDASCAVHFMRLSDKRREVVPYWTEYCNGDTPGELGLLGSRAVWSVGGGGLSSAHAAVSTATFGDAEQHELATGEGQCESDYCPFHGPLIDASGESLVFVKGAEGPRTDIWRLADRGFERLHVTVGSNLAVQGNELAVLQENSVVELHRLGDGSLIRRWRAVHPQGRFGNVALSRSSLVLQSTDSGGWIDLYDTATGQLVRSILGNPDVAPQPFADGVVYFSGRRLLYVGATGEPITLTTAHGSPVALVVSGRRALWIEYERSTVVQRLYSLELQSRP